MQIHIDIRTILIVHSLVSITLAALMAVFWRGHRGIPGLGHWTVGSASLGLAILGVGLRDVLPGFVSIVVVNSLFVVCLAALWNGIRLFDGRPARWRGALAALVGTAAFLVYRTYVVDDLPSRAALVTAVLSAGCLLCAWELMRGPARAFRETAAPAAVLLALLAVTMPIRAVSATSWALHPDMFAPGPAQGMNSLLSLLVNILLLVTLLAMAMQRLEQQVKARNAELERARVLAEAASRAKSAFLATMSHELRTPLNAIIGFSDMQRRELFGPLGHPRYREYAADIHASGTHLLAVITTILDISKAEAGKLEVVPVDLDARSILEAAMPVIRNAAEAKRIGLSAEIPGTPLACRADPQALKQILLNLLSNAVKFTPEGGAVTVQLCGLADGKVEFTVRDTGIGIAAADLPRLMKPFEQGTRGYSRRNGGTGLGLPLVDTLVRLHGGTLDIDSRAGIGTAVAVRLPAPESVAPVP